MVDQFYEAGDDYKVSIGGKLIEGRKIQLPPEVAINYDRKVGNRKFSPNYFVMSKDKLNVYPNNVEWSGKLIDDDIEFSLSIGENSGIYINGTMIKVDEDFLTTLSKLQQFYQKFKSKWGKVLANRKKTKESPE